MKARLIVFPMKGRNWCFSRSNANRLVPDLDSGQNPSTFTDLWKKISSNSSKPLSANAEVLVDFVSNKMNKGWIGLENAPSGTIKKKIHGLGLSLLSRVKPSEIFLKSISKEVSQLEITYPSSLNAQLVRRRLRHIATRGAIIHRKYFYRSATLLPFSTAFGVLPLPNIIFFWVLFRTYSHWRALQGSERLLHLISVYSEAKESTGVNENGIESYSRSYPLVMLPSEELKKLLDHEDAQEGLSELTISDICKTFDLNKMDIVKYQVTM